MREREREREREIHAHSSLLLAADHHHDIPTTWLIPIDKSDITLIPTPRSAALLPYLRIQQNSLHLLA